MKNADVSNAEEDSIDAEEMPLKNEERVRHDAL